MPLFRQVLAAILACLQMSLPFPAYAAGTGTTGMLPQPSPAVLGEAPPNPDFLQYQQKSLLGLVQSSSLDGHPLGALPNITPPPQPSTIPRAFAVGFPATYDQRTLNKLTPVRDQVHCGDCWAFAAYSSLESGLKAKEARDFSEAHLNDTHGFDFAWCQGGNLNMATAYLARWSGPGDDADYPTPISTNSLGITVQKHVQDVDCLPVPARRTMMR